MCLAEPQQQSQPGTTTAAAAAARSRSGSIGAGGGGGEAGGPTSVAAETLIVFDWDDTLLSSTFLARRGLTLQTTVVPPAARAQLRLLERDALSLLTEASNRGHVVIITNAETGWVELSAKKFMPSVSAHLHRFRIVSARSTYEAMHPDCPMSWKRVAFRAEIEGAAAALASDILNVLSFGDSVHERDAVRAATAPLGDKALTKAIKFVVAPDVLQLRRQITFVRESLGYLVSQPQNLDIVLSVEGNAVTSSQ